jgi:signal transduction histidine kinase
MSKGKLIFFLIFICILFCPLKASAINEIADTSAIGIDSILKTCQLKIETVPAEAIPLCKSGILLAKQYKLNKQEIEFYLIIGRAYYLIGLYNEALEYLIKAEKLSDERNEEILKAKAILNQGNVYWFNKNYTHALQLYKQAQQIGNTKKNPEIISWALNNIGIIYHQMHEYDSALTYLNHAILIRKDENDQKGLHTSYFNLGEIYADMEFYDLAIHFQLMAIEDSGKYLSADKYAHYMIDVGELHTKTGKYANAEFYFKKGLEKALESKAIYTIHYSYFNLAQFYKQQNKPDKAYDYLYKAHSIRDSVYNKEMSEKVANLLVVRESEQKEKEIKLLTTEKNLAKETLRKRKIIQNITILILLLIIVIATLGIKQYRIQKKFNDKLQKQVEEKTHELAIALERAEKSDRLKTKFLQNMSHEVRTPLNAIHGFSGLLADESSINETLKDYTSTIIRNSNYLIELFDNITIISRLENNDYFFNSGNFMLMPVLSEIAAIFTKRTIDKHIEAVEFESDFKGIDENTIIYSDFENLNRVLYNLLDNALKFTNRGKIIFGVQKQSNYFVFNISDTGTGIPTDYQSHIFEKFQKFNSQNDKYTRGAGLGLPIAKLIVERLRGEIWFESIQGEGTNFHVKIPVS